MYILVFLNTFVTKNKLVNALPFRDLCVKHFLAAVNLL